MSAYDDDEYVDTNELATALPRGQTASAGARESKTMHLLLVFLFQQQALDKNLVCRKKYWRFKNQISHGR